MRFMDRAPTGVRFAPAAVPGPCTPVANGFALRLKPLTRQADRPGEVTRSGVRGPKGPSPRNQTHETRHEPSAASRAPRIARILARHRAARGARVLPGPGVQHRLLGPAGVGIERVRGVYRPAREG